MKILLLTLNQDINIISHFDLWYEDLAKVCDLNIRKRDIDGDGAFWNWGRRMIQNPNQLPTFIRDTKTRTMYPLVKLSDINSKYDWVITDFSYAFFTEDWHKIKIPKAMIIEDSCHGLPFRQVQVAIDNKFDVLFCRYFQEFNKYQKKHLHEFASIRWLPHSVNLDMFKDYELEKKYDVTMTGYHFPPYYFYRDMMFDEIEDKEYFTELKHKGYSIKGGTIHGEDYAMFLNQSKISITCGMVYNRPVMKFFEIPAVRTLLYSNMFRDLKELGFKDSENMVVYKPDKADQQLRDLLEDDAMRQEITNNGYKFVRKHHSGEVRAKQFIKELEK